MFDSDKKPVILWRVKSKNIRNVIVTIGMMKISVVLACMVIGLSGCGNKPDLTAIKAQLDQIQQRQMMLWTNNYYLWAEMESIRTNVTRLPDAATINSIAYFYHTNELAEIRSSASFVAKQTDPIMEEGLIIFTNQSQNFQALDLFTTETRQSVDQIKTKLGIP